MFKAFTKNEVAISRSAPVATDWWTLLAQFDEFRTAVVFKKLVKN